MNARSWAGGRAASPCGSPGSHPRCQSSDGGADLRVGLAVTADFAHYSTMVPGLTQKDVEGGAAKGDIPNLDCRRDPGIRSTRGPGQLPRHLRALPFKGDQGRSRCLALATHARCWIRGRVNPSMPSPAKSPDAGEGRPSELVAEARTGRRLPTTLHHGSNRMREARERIHVRRDLIKFLAPCAGPMQVAHTVLTSSG